jgi:membrane fusion protein, multidrug efflux system
LYPIVKFVPFAVLLCGNSHKFARFAACQAQGSALPNRVSLGAIIVARQKENIMTSQTPPDQKGLLKFDNDAGAGRSKWVAGFFAVVLVVWMGSGFILPSAGNEPAAQDSAPARATVAVINSTAQDIALTLSAEGQSIPDRSALVRAKADGQIASVAVSRGDLVETGQEIARIDADIAQANLMQAQTQLDQAQRDFDNASALQDRGIATQDRVSQTRAALAAAQAALTAAQDRLDNTVITAPFSGRLNDLTISIGESVESGDLIAEVLDNDPLTVVVQVPQQALARIKQGQSADVSFITGEEVTGTIGFIGANADQQTRTFRVEIDVANAGSVMPAGLSARVSLPTGQARGHFVSPAILSLDTDGVLGVKSVDAENRVVFSPVTIVRAETGGVWVSGLPDSTQIITVGQGFVNAGDLVTPRADTAALTAQVAP